MANTLNISLIIRAVDRATAPIRAITQNFKAFRAAADLANKHFETAANLRNAAEGVSRFSRGALGMIRAPLSDAIEFQQAMSKVQAKAGTSAVELKELTATARRLGADTSFSAMEAAAGLEMLAAQGFDTKQMIATLPSVLSLAAAADTGLARASEITAGVMQGFRLSTADSVRVVDVLSTAANKSSANVEDLGETFKFAASMGASLNVSLEDMAGMTAVLAQSQIGGSMAGTSQRQLLARLAAPRGPGEQWFQTLGINRSDDKGNLRGVVALLGELQQKLSGLGSMKRIKVLSDIFGVESLTAADVLVNSMQTGALPKMIQAHMPENAAGQTAKTAATMMDNTAGSVEELSGSLQDLRIEIGDQLLPTVRSFAEGLKVVVNGVKSWVAEHPTLTRGLVVSTAAVGSLAFVASAAIFSIAALVSVLGVLAYASGSSRTGVEILGGALRGLIAWMRSTTVAAALPTFTRWATSVRAASAAFMTGAIPALRAFAASTATAAATLWTRLVAGLSAAAAAVGRFVAALVSRLFPTFIAFGRAVALATVQIVRMSVFLVTRAVGAVVAFMAPLARLGVMLVVRTTIAVYGFIASIVRMSVVLLTRAVVSAGAFIVSLLAMAATFVLTAIPAIWAATTAFIGFALAMLATPVGWIAAAIAVIAAGGFLIYRNWGALKGWFLDFGPSVQGSLALLLGPIGVLIGLPVLLMKYWEPVKAFFKDLWEGVKAGFTSTVELISSSLQPLLELLGLAQSKAADEVAKGPDAQLGAPRQTFTAETAGAPGTNGRSPVSGEISVHVTTDPGARAETKSLRSSDDLDLSVHTGLAMAGT